MEIQCIFNQNAEGRYMCIVPDVEILQRCVAESFIDTHMEGKSNVDVEILMFLGKTVHYLPSLISHIFPQIKSLVVKSCGLKELLALDLLGLDKLTELVLFNNNLTTLPKDLFTCTPKLERFVSCFNKLDNLSSELVDSIPDHQWERFYLLDYPNVDGFYGLGSSGRLKSVQELRDVINASFSQSILPPMNATMRETFLKLLVIKDSSDFTIIVGEKKIQVHKSVLAAQSLVFVSIFKRIDEKNLSKCHRITNYSEEVVDKFIRYLYTGKINANATNQIQIFSLICDYKVGELKKEFEKKVVKQVRKQNALELSLEAYAIGMLYNSGELIKAANLVMDSVIKNEKSKFLDIEHNPILSKDLSRIIQRFEKSKEDINKQMHDQ